MMQNKNTRAEFEPPSHTLPPIVFFVLPVNINKIAGVLNPHKTKVSIIAIRHTGHIKRARGSG